jgi:hypothetical protein
MNLLTDIMPTAVMIDGKETSINSDFRTCLRIITAFEDNELTGLEKQLVLLTNLYPDKPENVKAAVEQGIKFLNGGKVDDEESHEKHRLYSFEKDAPFILAAFRQTHGIDLETADMHWWKFLALFMDLGGETTFSNLVSLRKRVKSGKASKEEKAAAREISEIFDLPELDTLTLEQKENVEDFERKRKAAREEKRRKRAEKRATL